MRRALNAGLPLSVRLSYVTAGSLAGPRMLHRVSFRPHRQESQGAPHLPCRRQQDDPRQPDPRPRGPGRRAGRRLCRRRKRGGHLAGLACRRWQLVVVDVFLKRGSGLGVLRTCRQRSRASAQWSSGNYVNADIRARCAALGADAVFDKSAGARGLLRLLQRSPAAAPCKKGALRALLAPREAPCFSSRRHYGDLRACTTLVGVAASGRRS